MKLILFIHSISIYWTPSECFLILPITICLAFVTPCHTQGTVLDSGGVQRVQFYLYVWRVPERLCKDKHTILQTLSAMEKYKLKCFSWGADMNYYYLRVLFCFFSETLCLKALICLADRSIVIQWQCSIAELLLDFRVRWLGFEF